MPWRLQDVQSKIVQSEVVAEYPAISNIEEQADAAQNQFTRNRPGPSTAPLCLMSALPPQRWHDLGDNKSDNELLNHNSTINKASRPFAKPNTLKSMTVRTPTT